MAKNPIEECEKLVADLKRLMVNSRLVAFTDLGQGNPSLTRDILFWQNFNPTYLLTIDYSRYENTGKFRTLVTKVRGTATGGLVHGHPTYIKSASYRKKKDFVGVFENWLKKEIKPRYTPTLKL